MRRLLPAIAFSVFVTVPLFASTYTVNDLGDFPDALAGDDICDAGSGICTLRAAIQEANAHAGSDSIAFGVAGTISPATALPAITETTNIDGTTAPGYAAADPVVFLDGVGAITIGLDFSTTATDSELLALHIAGFTTAGVNIDGSGVHVARCYIGPVLGGTANFDGIVVAATAADTLIGGGDGIGNVISGNTGDGLVIHGDTTVVRGNIIGLDETGAAALGNLLDGIHIHPTAADTDIGGTEAFETNTISANVFDGIFIEGGTNTRIFGNHIGTDVLGMNDLGNEEDGVHDEAGQGTIIGLPAAGNVISGNAITGVFIDFDALDPVIDGNIIGMDVLAANALGNDEDGVYSLGTNTIVGTPAAGNQVSGNGRSGIVIDGTDATIQNNNVGLDPASNIIGNFDGGIVIIDSLGPVLIGGTGTDEGNIVSGNLSAGIALAFSSGVEIYGNNVGLNAARDDIRGNAGFGIEVFIASDVIIGSVGPGMNVISGNSDSGIDHVFADNVDIIGNRIGTDGTGMSALGNLAAGVEICDSTTDVLVDQNLISGNDMWGVWLMSNATASTVSNNIIGLNADQSAAVPNGDVGVLMTDEVTDNTIGPGNIISGNGGFGSGIGVAVTMDAEPPAGNNRITENSIFDNDGLGIDLGGSFFAAGDGVTANDAGDGDFGPNGFQNYPVITAAVTSPSAGSIQGTFNSTASTVFDLHFYENTAADGSGFGEGQTYLGTTAVTTDALGDATFIFNGPAMTVGNFVTATATSPVDGTSEFSEAFEIVTAPTIQLNPSGYNVTENAVSVIVTVTRTGDTTAVSTVDYTTSDNSATAGDDYTTSSGTLTFDVGETSLTFAVPILEDSVDEPLEVIDLTLSNPTAASLGTSSGTISIDDDDAPPQIDIDDVTLAEGNAGTTTFTFTISLSNPSAFTVSVLASTVDGSASSASDYSGFTNQTVTFNPNDTSEQVTVSVNGDLMFESNEDFTVVLSGESNATINDGSGLGTINNDDGQPVISINDVTLDEGDAGTTPFTFLVSLSNPSDQTITVNAVSNDGSASSASDFTALASTLITFNPGDISESVTVDVNGDTMFESTEDFTVTLSGESNATVGDGSGLGTITNDDGQPTISIADVSLNEGNAGTTAFDFAITLSNPSDQTITVNAASSDGTASSTTDFSALGSTLVTFNPGDISETVTVDVDGDTMFEDGETFTVALSGETNATINDGSGLGTIVNDDGQPTISIDDVSLPEGNAGTTPFGFAVSLSNPSEQTITVNATTAAGTAGSGSDFNPASVLITFDPGETTQPFTVDVIGDLSFEDDETFAVNLAGAVNATIADNQGAGTIENDDGLPEIFIDDVALAEGNAGTTAFTFTLSLSNPSEQTVTVNAATAAGTATAGVDFTSVGSTPVTFTAGDTSETFTVLVNGDVTFEPDETFFVNLSGEQQATLGDSQGLGTIENDDAQPEISIDDVPLAEGNAGTTAFTFTVTLTNPSSQTVTVDASTSAGTATAGSDYASVATTTLTFNPGDTSLSFTVNVNGDVTFEDDETFFVDLANPVNATVADNQGLGTIENDDSLPEISIDDVTLAEGNAGNTPFLFTISLSHPSEQTITVNAATAALSATAGSDYTTVPPTVITFLPGDTSESITVNVIGDTTEEPSETFRVLLTGEVNGVITDGEGLGNIINDDGEPSIFIDDVTLAEGNAGTTSFAFTVSLSNPSAQTITVNAATADGTADSTSDYTTATDTLTFAPGVTSQEFTVDVAGDTMFESDETFFVDLSGATNATISDAQGLGTIDNDDGQPTISVDDVTLDEGNAGTTAFTFTVSLSNASDQEITVNAGTADGTALDPVDYQTVGPNLLTFAPGTTTQPFTVQVGGDTTFESTETFFVDLSAATNASISDDQGLGTITNDDGLPAISVDDVTLPEGNAGATAFQFTLSLSNPSDQVITVDVASANGTALAGSDYDTLSTTVTFPAGEVAQTVTVDVTGDVIDEANETFFLDLSAATNATVADDQGLGTIVNDDGVPSILIDDVTLAEGDAGTTTFTFTVSLSNPSAQTVTVNAATADMTAAAGVDYTAVPSTLITFAPGVTSQSFDVDVAGDTTFEPNETFFVDLSGATNAFIADPQGVGTITNDDAVPAISIDDVTLAEGNAGTTAFVFNITLSNASSQTVTVNAATADMTATAGVDYTAVPTTLISFAPGVTSQPFSVDVIGDTADEPNQTFFVNLTSATNATIADDQGMGTIVDDDGEPTISIDDVTLSEGDAGNTSFGFIISLSNPSSVTVTVNAVTANMTATAGSDYTAVASTLITFAPGVTTQPFNVDVTGDTAVEANETFFVNLSGATNATIADNQGVGTIVNDDAPGSSADLGLGMAAGASTFTPGQQVTFTLQVTNGGPDDASAVTVTNPVPAGASLVSFNSADASCSGTTTMVCTIPTLGNGQTATITIVLQLNANAPITNTATVSAAEADGDMGDNTASATLTPAAAPGDPSDIPTTSEWGLMLLAAALGLVAVTRMTR